MQFKHLPAPRLSIVSIALGVALLLAAALGGAGVYAARAYYAIDTAAQHIYDTHVEVVADSARQVRALEHLVRGTDALLRIDDAAARHETRADLASVASDGVLQGNEDTRLAVAATVALLDPCLADIARGGRAPRAACLARWQPLRQTLIDRMEAIAAEAAISATRDVDAIIDTVAQARRALGVSIVAGVTALLLCLAGYLFFVARPLLRITRSLRLARDGYQLVAGQEALREMQTLNDAAVALADAHREVRDTRAELENLANTDQLTALANRRYFTRVSELEMKRHRRYGNPLALICLDIDFFKKINDSHGHDGGDAVLRAFSALLSRSVRPTDTAARLGGEEFAVLLPEIAIADALTVAERLRRAVADLRVDLPDGGVCTLTCSIGVSCARADESEVGTLLQRADKALYRAKDAGRDRVEAECLTSAAAAAETLR